MIFKITVTIVFTVVLLVRTFTNIEVDNTSILLVLLAIMPWLVQYIKSFEINGVGKIDLIDIEDKVRLDRIADKEGMNEKEVIDYDKYTFYNLRNQDVRLALAGLRIEIESKLRHIADSEGVEIKKGSILLIARTLNENNILNQNEMQMLQEITKILNYAVHSDLKEYQIESVDWVFNMGLKLLNSLEVKLR